MTSLRKVHRWLAIGAILPGLLVLVSGAGLSFAKEIDRFAQPSLLSVAATGEIELRAVHSFVAAQLQENPQWTLGQIRYPSGPYDPIVLNVQARSVQAEGVRASDLGADTLTLLYLNPHTGKFLGQRPQASELAERLRRLHVALISPTAGQLLAILIGVVLLVMVGLGICLSRHEGRWRLSSWHARLGVFIAPILLSIVGSGLFSVYGPGDLRVAAEQPSRNIQAAGVPVKLLGLLSGQLPAACAKRPVSLTALEGRVSLRCEDGVILTVSATADTVHSQLERESGQLLWNLHSGALLGLPGRAIWMWSVLAVLYLLYSGLRDWQLRKNKGTYEN